jgi:hypothetical protein
MGTRFRRFYLLVLYKRRRATTSLFWEAIASESGGVGACVLCIDVRPGIEEHFYYFFWSTPYCVVEGCITVGAARVDLGTGGDKKLHRLNLALIYCFAPHDHTGMKGVFSTNFALTAQRVVKGRRPIIIRRIQIGLGG